MFFQSCDLLKKEEPQNIVARVGDNFLFSSDIDKLTDEGMSKEDSTLVVNNYINNWATQQLLIRKAQLNLNEDKQEEFNKLVNNYKNDLFTRAYKEAIVKQRIDTIVSEQEAIDYYGDHKDNFTLNDRLLKLRYIQTTKDNQNFNKIKERFLRFDSEDKYVLDSIAIQFMSYSLNDTTWVKANQVFKKIPLIKTQEKEELLKKSNFIQLEDSLRVYLVQINDVLERNEVAPLVYVEPTVKQIIINKRKLELIKQLEIDITEDAIKNKEFEIYE
ncbi:MAG: peptidyl-prolyl cis-trans isomerase [Flavobacteriaceae bacterium]|nr:peptidyl-prolyl cis-trans isomerase [Flavobacteriaceae bacterium]